MAGGLSLWENNGDNVSLDADNLFWAVTSSLNKSNMFIPQEVLTLYAKVKDKLVTEINNFRFSQELTAIYIDPTDKCNANCSYCYPPLVAIAERLKYLKEKDMTEVLAISSVGPAFFAITPNVEVVVKAFEKEHLKTFATDIENGKYALVNKQI